MIGPETWNPLFGSTFAPGQSGFKEQDLAFWATDESEDQVPPLPNDREGIIA